jgi:MOSC domain-containing protein YiiM
MWKGEVVSTHLAPEAAVPMVPMTEVQAVAGKGIEGDRYSKEIGFFSHNKGVHRQVTLFETEVLETIKRDHNKDISPNECRMNLVTRDVPLTHLVGKKFRIGEATLRGVKLNEPCKHLEEVIGKPIISSLIHRCGLFAEVLEDGVIRPGDSVEETNPSN